MSLKLQKETINLNEVLCADYGHAIVENDVIVPDVKPDILKILRVDGESVITQKSIQQDRIVIQGHIRFNILYVPEGDEIVSSMQTVQMFTHVVDVKGARPAMSLFAEAETEDVEYTLLNSRKLSVRASVGIGVKAFCRSSVEMAVPDPDDSDIQTKGEIIKAYNLSAEAENEFTLREKIEVPAGKPAISEIYKLDVRVVEKDMRIVENKLVVKGHLEISTLYGSVAEDEQSIELMEHQAQFNEILEMTSIPEGAESDISYCIKNLSYDTADDIINERRSVILEITVGAAVKISEVVEINVIGDAYSLDGDLQIKTGSHNIEQLVGKISTQIAHRDLLAIPEHLPEIKQVFTCKAKPSVTEIRTENGRITLEGSIETRILYLTHDNSNPLVSYKHKSEFVHTVEMNGVEDKVQCDTKLDALHISYNMTMERELELRFILGLGIKAVRASRTDIIEEISKVENAAIDPRPSIVIYFVQQGDTLWSIAKKYRTTPAMIINSNGLSSDVLHEGQQLMI